MIPRTLLTVFLSLQSLEKPSQDTQPQHDIKVIGDSKPSQDTQPQHDIKVIGDSKPTVDINQEPMIFPQGDEHAMEKRIVYPFDDLPSGDWNNDLIIEGAQITNNATARLWSMPDAFPNIKPSHGGKKAWGPYPEGKNFTIRFSQPARGIVRTFGWVVNGRLSAGSYQTAIRNQGKWIAGGSGSWGNDQWTTWNFAYDCDQVDITVTEGIPTGLLLFDYLAYTMAE